MNQHLELIQQTRHQCDRFFAENGYFLHPSEPIVPETDRSVLYTNSAIIPFKKMIAENTIPNKPLYIFQECIRLHETRFTPNEAYFLQRMSCFSMFGVFSPIYFLEKSCRDILTLLLNILQIDKNRIVLHASSQDREFWEHVNSLGISVLWDKTPANEYQWRYGMDDVVGRGLNIGILPHGANSEMISSVDDIDIGQIIVIKKHDQPICFEVALGVEAFLWRSSGKESPFAVAEIAAFMPFNYDPLHMQLMDAIVQSIIYYGNNVDLYCGSTLRLNKSKSRISAIKKAIKNIAEIEKLVASDFDVDKIIIEYYNYRGFSSHGLARLLETLYYERMNFSTKEAKIFEYAKTCADFINAKKITYLEACDRIHDKAKRVYSLYPRIIQSAVNHMDCLLERCKN